MKRFFGLLIFAGFAILAFGDAARAQQNGAPKEFVNSLGMKFVWIPPGTFLMGSPTDEYERRDNETQHKVTLTKGFFMGVHPVTQAQWQELMGSNPSRFRGSRNLPVEMVSWNDCQEFVKKLCLKEKDQKHYRLPTEAEWEYACRAGTATPFHFGTTISTEQANYNGAVYGSGKLGEVRDSTSIVGIFPANAWGLRDMHGNVWQWCQDFYGEYSRADAVDPRGPESGDFHVLRGGAWNGSPSYCRSAFRVKIEPSLRLYNFGFRVCFNVD